MASRAEQVDKKQLGDSERVLEECIALENDLAELKAKYEQFFLGVDRVPPSKLHDAVKRRVAAVKGLFLRQTAMKFRVQSLAAKLTTWERLWDRTMKEIEAGTYRRDLFKAKLHQQKRAAKGDGAADGPAKPAEPRVDEDLDLSDLDEPGADPLAAALAQATAAVSKPPPAAPVNGAAPQVAPAIPAAKPPVASPQRPIITPVLPSYPSLPSIAAPRPAPPNSRPDSAPPAVRAVETPRPPGTQTGAGGALSDQKIKAIYEAYLMAKKRCGEDTRSLTLDSVASTLKKQVPELMRQHNARSVEFKVVIKDGKAVLRALPKDT